MTDNATLARSMYDAWNERDFDREAALWADEGVITFVGSGQQFRGPDGSRQFSTMWADAFPDGRNQRGPRRRGPTRSSWWSSPATAPTPAP